MTEEQLAVFRALVEDQQQYGPGVGSRTRNDELAFLCPAALTEIDRLNALLSRNITPRGVCAWCGKETNSLAASPLVWPIEFPHADGTGKCQTHCTECVTRRCEEVDRLRVEMEALKRACEQLVHQNIALMNRDVP